MTPHRIVRAYYFDVSPQKPLIAAESSILFYTDTIAADCGIGENAMRRIIRLVIAVGLLCMPFGAIAQDDEDQTAYVYATYYACDQATQGAMDNVVETNEKPVFDRWVEEGKLMSWGYYSHFTGGAWRRLQYHVSPTMADALNNQAAIFQEIYADNPAGGQARAEACGSHTDYVWASGQGSDLPDDRPAVSLSIYYVCDVAGEQRADEIFSQTYAPKLDELVEEGAIDGWGWQMHRLGGRYRRLGVITGDDYASVVAARGEALQHVNRNHEALGREFAGICGAHADYIWDIVH